MLSLSELLEKIREAEAAHVLEWKSWQDRQPQYYAGREASPLAFMTLSPEAIRYLAASPDLVKGGGEPIDIFSEIEILGFKIVPDFTLGPNEVKFSTNADEYGPRLRLARVCHILTSWAKAYGTPLPTDSGHMTEERRKFTEAWQTVELAIRKSNCLARMFFGGESLRREPCPIHQGRWSGISWKQPECATEHFPQGCQETGWMPTETGMGIPADNDATGHSH